MVLSCSDLGVFIGAMDENGFAAKSGRLQVQDRILACNGVDFTKETNQRFVAEPDRFTNDSSLSLLVFYYSSSLNLGGFVPSWLTPKLLLLRFGHYTHLT